MSRRAWAGFGAVATLWGIPYLFIRIAVDDGVPPVFLAWARVTMAAAVLLVLAWRAGVLPSLRGRWPWVAAYAIVEIAIPFPLIGFGEQRVSSSLAAILIAAVPLIMTVLAIRMDPSERATGWRLVGLCVGLAGVVALVGIDVAGRTDELVGALAILLAAAGYATGPMLLKRDLSGIDARAVMGGSLAIVAVVLAPFAAIAAPERAPSAGALASIVVLGLFCTALAFVLFANLLAEIGPSRASVITYVAPVVAVALGVAVLDERPGVGAVAGLLLILAGSWLSAGSGPGGLRRRRVAAAAAP
ncbi:MAG: DMT family transporter [Solirubrobacteraceae bacterium]